MAIALRLSKSGYGTIKEIMELPSDYIMTALDYELFLQEYEEKFIEINREDK